MQTTEPKTLSIHKLTKQQYDKAKNENNIDTGSVYVVDPSTVGSTTAQILEWQTGDTSSSLPNTTTDQPETIYVSTSLPHLSDTQKQQMKTLMDEYFSSGLFLYDGSFRRESYAYPNYVDSLNSSNTNGCKYKDSTGDWYITNCGVFAQMIWMGRALSDYTATPTTNITKAFDWGYYFNFLAAKRAWGVTKADGSYYSGNSYLDASGNRKFIGFDGAATMASELYAMGCEIPYSEVEVGDLVFYRSPSLIDGSIDEIEQTVFRYITHVGIVYNVDPVYGPTIMESTNAYSASIGKSGLGPDVSKFGNVRGAGQEQRVTMAARHPAAWGKGGNVPDKFVTYRGTEVQS